MVNPFIRNNMKLIHMVLLMIVLVFVNAACSQPAANSNPPGYNLSKPIVYKMPSVLEEISGITFIRGNADTIFAEQDEEGKLFYFHLGDKEVRHTKFSKKGDYEDVAICNNQVIMLRSDGVFFTFPLSSIGNKEIDNTNEQNGLLPPGEYESLFADENNNSLYVLCKNCSDDKAEGKISGFIFSVGADGKISAKDQFAIDEEALVNLTGKKKIKLKASGMARNPITQQWFILSSVNKLLVVTDASWKPLNAYPLNPSLFTQPEGIAFDKAANLFIANERGTGESGSILQFNLQKK